MKFVAEIQKDDFRFCLGLKVRLFVFRFLIEVSFLVALASLLTTSKNDNGRPLNNEIVNP